MEMLEHTTKPRGADDLAVLVSCLDGRVDDHVSDTLVRSFLVIVDGILADDVAKMTLSQRDDLGEALGLDGEDESLGEGVQVRALRRKPDGLHASLAEDHSKLLREDRIPVHDEVAGALQEAVDSIGEVARNLFGPISAGVVGDTRDLDAAGGKVDSEEHVASDEARECEHLGGEGIDGRDASEVGVDEGLPGCALAALGGRLDAGLAEDARDGASGDADSQVSESALDSRVTPRSALGSDGDDQLTGLVGYRWSSAAVAPMAAIVLPRDEHAVPAKESVGSDDGSEPAKRSARHTLRSASQAPPLRVGEAEAPSGSSELLAQDGVLCLQVEQRTLLMPRDEASGGEDEEGEGGWEHEVDLRPRTQHRPEECPFACVPRGLAGARKR